MIPEINIAVLVQEHSPVEPSGDQHIVELDEIPITQTLFRQIFYSQDTFYINPAIKQDALLAPYISFLTRTYRTRSFSLLSELLGNLETDLNTSRNAFTPASLIELQKSIVSIQSLADLNCLSLSSLTWTDIQSMLQYDYVFNGVAVLIINVVFKSDTVGALPTNVKFKYKVSRV